MVPLGSDPNGTFLGIGPNEIVRVYRPNILVYFPINQLFANMKKEEICLRLEEIRTALAEADAERLRAGVSAQEREFMA